MDCPRYLHSPIQSLQSLSRALRAPEPLIRSVAARASNLYIGPKPLPKKNGGVRYVFDTKPPLKPLLREINEVIFRETYFPAYLTGSLAGRDYVANVDIHKGARRAVSEDIANFFDCITASHVYGVWHECFGFGEEVADILTRLTTKDGQLIQGTPTSSYLANLALWSREPALVERLAARGMRYSRYVDDITVSSAEEMTEEDKQWAIAQIYGLIGASGFRPKRAKHFATTAKGPITIMGLNANSSKQPTLTKQERAGIRTQIFQLEMRLARGDVDLEFRQALTRAGGKLGRLKRLHRTEGIALQDRLKRMQETIRSLPFITGASMASENLTSESAASSVGPSHSGRQ